VAVAPEQLGALLQQLQPKLDHARAVQVLRKASHLAQCVPYLRAVQKANLAAINDALNEVLIEDGDHEGLQASIDEFSNFDHVALAQRLEKHELLQFRRVAASLYAKQKKFGEALRILKADKLYKDVVSTAASSKDEKLVVDVLNFFVDAGEKECFSAALFACYDLVAPDLVLELAWRKQLVDQAMPFLIQWTHHTHVRLRELDERTKPAGAGGGAQSGAPASGLMLDPLGSPYLLANAAYNPDPHSAAAAAMHQQQVIMMQHQQAQAQYLQQQQQFGGAGYNGGGF